MKAREITITTICGTVLLLAVTSTVISQPQRVEERQQVRARLFDSYGAINGEDLMARLDNFGIQLQNEPTVTAHIVVYGPDGDGAGSGKHLLSITKDYLTNTRGIDESRLDGLYSGRYKDPKESLTELWLVPFGAEPRPTHEYTPNIREIKGKFAEYSEYDGLPECGGPCVGSVTMAGFADVLRQQPDHVAYIVAYNQPGANIGTWRRVAKSIAADLESRGVPSDRIKIVFAGTKKLTDDKYAQQAFIQLWTLPKTAPAPVKEARAEGIPTKAVQLGVFHDYELKYQSTEEWAFQGFADVLKANGSLGVFIIVRPPLAAGFRDPEFPPLANEPPDVDLKHLLEKWKSKLAKDYLIDNRRVFAVIAAAQEGQEGTIETWIVPPGASLPDPYANDSGDPKELMEFNYVNHNHHSNSATAVRRRAV